jgi:hypothetical protein
MGRSVQEALLINLLSMMTNLDTTFFDLQNCFDEKNHARQAVSSLDKHNVELRPAWAEYRLLLLILVLASAHRVIAFCFGPVYFPLSVNRSAVFLPVL